MKTTIFSHATTFHLRSPPTVTRHRFPPVILPSTGGIVRKNDFQCKAISKSRTQDHLPPPPVIVFLP
nr:ent-copalyl diphosphate synthase, chloroplastic-like [Tanacetum cinerariifolium]